MGWKSERINCLIVSPDGVLKTGSGIPEVPKISRLTVRYLVTDHYISKIHYYSATR